MDEKKAIKSQLDEDTRQRLDRLLNKNKPQEPPAPQTVVEAQAPVVSGKSRATRLLDYTKSWYRWLAGSNSNKSQEQPPK